jgi:ATP-binding cassette subfamily B protein
MRRETLRLLALNKPYLGRLILAIVAAVVGILAGLWIPSIVGRIVQDVLIEGDRGSLWPLCGVIVGLSVLRGVANYLRRNLAGVVSVLVETDLRDRLFAHVQGLPVSFHDEWETGQLLARATGDLNAIRQFIAFGLLFLVILVGIVTGVLVEMFRADIYLGLVVVAFAPALFFVATRFTTLAASYIALGRQQLGEVASVVEQSTGGIRVLKAFGREDRQLRELEQRASALRDTDLAAVRIRAVYVPMLAFLPNLMLAATLGLGGWQVVEGNLGIDAIVQAYLLLAFMNFPLRNVGWILAMLQQAIAGSARVQEILDTDPDITDAPGALNLGRLDGRIELDHVTVQFPGSGRPALDDLSLTIEPGEIVAFAGPSGSGKSVLASLLSRFHDPDGGEVRLDGHALPTVTLHSLRSQVGVVFDEPVLFSASVVENIAFGDPAAGPDEIARAAAAAGVDDFVDVLPAGYETVVGEQGYGLSGGQRQRIALARALVMKPRVLVLDDPLSAVDARTEAAIEASLARIMRGRTVVLIAQRASTLAMADRIVLLDAGRVIAEGTHNELLLTEPRYSVLVGEADAEAALARRTAATVDDIAGAVT